MQHLSAPGYRHCNEGYSCIRFFLKEGRKWDWHESGFQILLPNACFICKINTTQSTICNIYSIKQKDPNTNASLCVSVSIGRIFHVLLKYYVPSIMCSSYRNFSGWDGKHIFARTRSSPLYWTWLSSDFSEWKRTHRGLYYYKNTIQPPLSIFHCLPVTALHPLTWWCDKTVLLHQFHFSLSMMYTGWSLLQLSLHCFLKKKIFWKIKNNTFNLRPKNHLSFELVPVVWLHWIVFKIPRRQWNKHLSKKHPILEHTCMPDRYLKLSSFQLGVVNLILERSTAFNRQHAGSIEADLHKHNPTPAPSSHPNLDNIQL